MLCYFGIVILDHGVGAGGGRYDIAANKTIRDKFFKDVLQQFLTTSIPYTRQIYAWEVMNEPIWAWATPIVGGMPGSGIVSENVVRDFLEEAVDIIRARGFVSTVGHRFYDDILRKGRGSMPQFHYYGWSIPVLPPIIGAGIDPTPVPAYRTPLCPFVGEFASLSPFSISRRSDYHGLTWHELGGRDMADTRTRVFERLKALHGHGYKLALVWPDLPDSPPDPSNDPLKLSPEAQAGIRDYQGWCP